MKNVAKLAAPILFALGMTAFAEDKPTMPPAAGEQPVATQPAAAQPAAKPAKKAKKSGKKGKKGKKADKMEDKGAK